MACIQECPQSLPGEYHSGGEIRPFFYGEYKIYDRIEKGRLAGAFRAAHSASNHPVLLLFLTGQAAQDPQRWQQIQSTLPSIVHPHVVRCYDAVDLQSYKFLVLENLHGMSVAEHLATHGALPPSQACLVTRHASAGLALLHQMGRPHGDMSPRNLWLDPSGITKLLIDPDVVLQSTGRSRLDDPRLDEARRGRAWLVTARDGAIWAQVKPDGSVETGGVNRRSPGSSPTP